MSPALKLAQQEPDERLVNEAAILAGVILGGETLSPGAAQECGLILREMRAETEAARLARRLAAHFHIEIPTVEDKAA